MLSIPDMKSITTMVVTHSSTPLSMSFNLFIFPLYIYKFFTPVSIKRLTTVRSYKLFAVIYPLLSPFIFRELLSCCLAIWVNSLYYSLFCANSYRPFKGMLSTKDYSPSANIYYDFSYETITVFSMICVFPCHI